MPMSIQQLRYVSEAVERCSYAEAARKLIVSPQTVSKAAASVEKRYGIQLFEIDGRGVKPTLLGRKFAEDAKLVVRAYDELNNKYGNSTTFREESTPVTIAIAKSSLRGEACSERLLNDIQQRFFRKRTHPSLSKRHVFKGSRGLPRRCVPDRWLMRSTKLPLRGAR